MIKLIGYKGNILREGIMIDIINLLSTSRMRKNAALYKGIICLLILCIVQLSFLSCKVKIVKLDERIQKNESVGSITEFNVAEYVDKPWDTQILPYFIEEAVDLNVLLQAAESDPLGATKKYAHTQTEENTNYNFVVKGTGKILSVNDATKGSINIDLCPYDNKTDVLVLIGPVISATLNSIRDAYDNLTYSMFINQIEWGSVGNRIKEIIKETVINDIDRKTLPGKRISFYGAFTLIKPDDFSEIIITPIKLEIEEND
ncbi:MAG: DUF2291 domain-containing protein [Spirochaetales bacterium]|nr:DUF2291 domain-containing protein [Spirochaetales bacterium]